MSDLVDLKIDPKFIGEPPGMHPHQRGRGITEG